jgi:hypothetical protein
VIILIKKTFKIILIITDIHYDLFVKTNAMRNHETLQICSKYYQKNYGHDNVIERNVNYFNVAMWCDNSVVIVHRNLYVE